MPTDTHTPSPHIVQEAREIARSIRNNNVDLRRSSVARLLPRVARVLEGLLGDDAAVPLPASSVPPAAHAASEPPKSVSPPAPPRPVPPLPPVVKPSAAPAAPASPSKIEEDSPAE